MPPFQPLPFLAGPVVCVRRPPSDVSWPPSHPRRGPLPAQSTGAPGSHTAPGSKDRQGVRRATSSQPTSQATNAHARSKLSITPHYASPGGAPTNTPLALFHQTGTSSARYATLPQWLPRLKHRKATLYKSEMLTTSLRGTTSAVPQT